MRCHWMTCCVGSKWQPSLKVKLHQHQILSAASVVAYCHQSVVTSHRIWIAATAITTTVTYLYMLVLALVSELSDVLVVIVMSLSAIVELTVFNMPNRLDHVSSHRKDSLRTCCWIFAWTCLVQIIALNVWWRKLQTYIEMLG